jgi:hypothetical protein
MKKFILFAVFILTISNLNGDPINTYESILIKTIQLGRQDGQLMLDKNVMPSGPITFMVSKKNIIYVGDTLNGRMSLFDLNFDFIKNISYIFKEDNIPYVPDTIKIDDKDNIILYSHQQGLYKLDASGGKQYFVSDEKKQLNLDGEDNYFSIDDYVFYYDQAGNLKIIDKEGTVKDDKAAKEIIKGYSTATTTRSSNTIDNQKLLDFAEKNKLLIVNNELLTTDYGKYMQIKKFYKATKPQTKGASPINNFDLKTISIVRYIGVDVNQNQYWQGELKITSNPPLILVFSKDGDVIDSFYIPKWVATTVAPNGDIYLMQSLETGISFYKVTRRW